MRASEFITEAVGGDYIYHSVAQPNQIWNILRKGVIQPHLSDTDEEGGWEIPVISASRSQYYRFPYGGGSIQLVLDRNALRQAGFKVMPFSYMQFYNQPDGTGPTASNTMYKQETEERIYHPKGIGIPVKKPYVVGIQIRKELMDKVPEGLLQLINDSGLELTTMKNDPTNKGTFSRKLAKPPLNKKHYYKPKDVQIVARANDPSKYDLWVTSFDSPMPLRDSDKDNNGLSVDRAKELFKSMTGGNPRGLQSTIEYDQDITRDYYHNPDGTGNKDWVPPIERTNNKVFEAINRRDLLKGVAGAAALGATGLAKAGEYKPYDELIKDKEALVNVWGPRLEQLQQRGNAMLNKLARTAGPAWAKQLAGTQLNIQSNDQYLQANAVNKSISMDLTVFWDAPDEVLAFAIAHELGHIALGHVGDVTPVQSRKEELDADDFAVKLCKALGYNKAGLFKFIHNKEAYFWTNLKSSSADSTHPNFDQRINRAKKQGFQLSKGGIQQMNTLMTHLA